MEIEGKDYHVIYDLETATITCGGFLQLYGADGYFSITAFEKSYAPGKPLVQQNEARRGYATIMDLLNKVVQQQPATITLNLRGLQALNSSGINVFSKFVIKVRNQQTSRLIVQGTHRFPWQGRALHNLQKLMPELVLEWERGE